jgi:hypothetical protein
MRGRHGLVLQVVVDSGATDGRCVAEALGGLLKDLERLAVPAIAILLD